MKKEIYLGTRKIEYDLERKRVKNINLRIKSDGTVHVSANTRVPTEVIERFMHEKSVFITRALDKYAAQQAKTNISRKPSCGHLSLTSSTRYIRTLKAAAFCTRRFGFGA